MSDKDRVFLQIAVTLGQLGTCDRAKVGAIITREGRAVSWGYNGAPPGLPHCDHSFDVSSTPCEIATHAEQNAIAFAARQGISTDGGTLYVERSPCAVCARLLIAAGIFRVVYATPYRDIEGLELLQKSGAIVDRLS